DDADADVEAAVVDRHDVAAAQGEDVRHAFVLERLGDDAPAVKLAHAMWALLWGEKDAAVIPLAVRGPQGESAALRLRRGGRPRRRARSAEDPRRRRPAFAIVRRVRARELLLGGRETQRHLARAEER